MIVDCQDLQHILRAEWNAHEDGRAATGPPERRMRLAGEVPGVRVEVLRELGGPAHRDRERRDWRVVGREQDDLEARLDQVADRVGRAAKVKEKRS